MRDTAAPGAAPGANAAVCLCNQGSATTPRAWDSVDPWGAPTEKPARRVAARCEAPGLTASPRLAGGLSVGHGFRDTALTGAGTLLSIDHEYRVKPTRADEIASVRVQHIENQRVVNPFVIIDQVGVGTHQRRRKR